MPGGRSFLPGTFWAIKFEGDPLPHRRRSSRGRACPVGPIYIFPQHCRAKATKRPGHAGPGLLSLRFQSACQYIRGHEPKAMRHCRRLNPHVDKCAYASFIEGGSSLDKLSVRSMRAWGFGRISSTAHLGGGRRAFPQQMSATATTNHLRKPYGFRQILNLRVCREAVQFTDNFLNSPIDLRA